MGLGWMDSPRRRLVTDRSLQIGRALRDVLPLRDRVVIGVGALCPRDDQGAARLDVSVTGREVMMIRERLEQWRPAGRGPTPP
jgi:hypothetical protein